MSNIQRRSRLDLNVPSELAIRAAIESVERMGADTRLTNAVVLLGKALDEVGNYVDNQPPRYADGHAVRGVRGGQAPDEPKLSRENPGYVAMAKMLADTEEP